MLEDRRDRDVRFEATRKKIEVAQGMPLGVLGVTLLGLQGVVNHLLHGLEMVEFTVLHSKFSPRIAKYTDEQWIIDRHLKEDILPIPDPQLESKSKE